MCEAAQWEIDEWAERCDVLVRGAGHLARLTPIVVTAHDHLVARGKYAAARCLREDWLYALEQVVELGAAAAYLAELQESRPKTLSGKAAVEAMLSDPELSWDEENAAAYEHACSKND